MARLTRRAFSAGLGAAVAAPVLAPAVAPGLARAAAGTDFDVIVVGAGAAGIAAARKLVAAKKRVAVLEAGERVGGRCFTDLRGFGRVCDQGAQWLHESERFQIAKLAAEAGLAIDRKGPAPELRVPIDRFDKRHGRFRAGRENELEALYGNLVRCTRAIGEAADLDITCAEALPVDLRDWRLTMEFLLGPFMCGAELSAMAAKDYALFERPDNSVRVREGAGTLMRRLALGLPIQYFSPVARILWGGGAVEADLGRTRLSAQALILTASTGVLAAGKVAFAPALPARYAEAIGKLRPGSVERVALEFDKAALPADKLLIEKAEDRRTAAAHLNVMGEGLAFVQLGGKLCAGLSAKGDEALKGFAREWLADQLGADALKGVKRTQATAWHKEPWTLGAFSAATPGSGAARKMLAKPLGERVWFAGEAVHDSAWGTVAGAWESGERAAEQALQATLHVGAR